MPEGAVPTTEILVISILKTVAVALGSLLTYLGWRAYRRQGQAGLRGFSLGMGILTVALLAEGVAYNVFGWTLAQAQILASAMSVTAFGVLVYALRP